MDRRFMFMEKMFRGLSAPPLGYIHVYDHNIQTSFSLIKAKLYVEHR